MNKKLGLTKWSTGSQSIILLTVKPSPTLDLTIRVVDLTISMLGSLQPIPNILPTIGVCIRPLALLFAIIIVSLVHPAIFPHSLAISVQLILFPFPFILHWWTDVMSLAIEFAVLPHSIITTAILVIDAPVALLDVVLKVTYVLVFFY